jgi:hypothetical protein
MAAILGNFFSTPESMKERLQLASSLLHQLTRGCLLGTVSASVPPYALTRSWSDLEGPAAYLVHTFPKETKLTHQETQIWTEVSCLGLTSDLYGSELWGLSYPITYTWASLSYRVSKLIWVFLKLSSTLCHLNQTRNWQDFLLLFILFFKSR